MLCRIFFSFIKEIKVKIGTVQYVYNCDSLKLSAFQLDPFNHNDINDKGTLREYGATAEYSLVNN